MQGYPLGNENSYKIIAGEENATQFILKSLPAYKDAVELTVEMVNSQGLGIAERELSEIEVDLVSYKGFILPVGMAVAGYSYVSIKAYLDNSSTTIENGTVSVDYTKLAPCKAYTFIYNGSAWELNKNVVNLSTYGITISGTPKENDIIQVREKVVFQPLKIKVWNTISQWQDYVDKTANVKVVDGYLILTENGNEYNLGYVRGEKGDKGEKGIQGEQGIQGATGAKLINQELVGQDENGGNIYQQTFDDGTVAYFTAPRGAQGEASTEEGEDLLTKTEADETYLSQTEADEIYIQKPENLYSATRETVTKLYQVQESTGKTDTLTVLMNGTFGFGIVQATGGANLALAVANDTHITEQQVGYRPICPNKLSLAVKVGVTANQNTLTDEEKASAQNWLGVKKYYTHALIFHKSGSLNFTVDRITSEPTAYLNCTTPMADNLFCTNSKSIVLNGINDPSKAKSGVGTLMATMTHYDDESGENSGVKLSGVWINYTTGEVSQVSNFEVPFEQDVVTEL